MLKFHAFGTSADSPLPFYIDCSVSKNSLDVYITIDSHILPRAKIQLMLSRFRPFSGNYALMLLERPLAIFAWRISQKMAPIQD
jgi:hypothetical protein